MDGRTGKITLAWPLSGVCGINAVLWGLYEFVLSDKTVIVTLRVYLFIYFQRQFKQDAWKIWHGGGAALNPGLVRHYTVICVFSQHTCGDQHIPWSLAIIQARLLAFGLIASVPLRLHFPLAKPPALLQHIIHPYVIPFFLEEPFLCPAACCCRVELVLQDVDLTQV